MRSARACLGRRSSQTLGRMPARSEINRAIGEEIRRRISFLRAESFPTLCGRPHWASDEASVLGKTVKFTTYVERYGDRLLVLVRSDEPRLFGMVSTGRTDGFWMKSDGGAQECTNADVLDYFS